MQQVQVSGHLPENPNLREMSGAAPAPELPHRRVKRCRWLGGQPSVADRIACARSSRALSQGLLCGLLFAEASLTKTASGRTHEIGKSRCLLPSVLGCLAPHFEHVAAGPRRPESGWLLEATARSSLDATIHRMVGIVIGFPDLEESCLLRWYTRSRTAMGRHQARRHHQEVGAMAGAARVVRHPKAVGMGECCALPVGGGACGCM